MSPRSSDYVEANTIKIHYQRTGGEKPPLVLSHGITDSGRCWPRVVPVLEKDYDLIMVDARGHGLSEAPETGYTTADHAADLAGLIQALGLEKPALMGHSMGAATSAATAATYPDRVGCAILEDPPWSETLGSAESREARFKEWHALMVERKSKSHQEMMADGREMNPKWSEIEFDPWAEAKLRVNLNALQMITGGGPSWRKIVAKITCPALLITGDPELGALVTAEAAAEATDLCPQLRVVHIDGAGHNIRREAFEPFMEAVTAFLAEHHQ